MAESKVVSYALISNNEIVLENVNVMTLNKIWNSNRYKTFNKA